MHTVPAWTYRPPHRPASPHSDQCYYGAAADGATGHYIAPYDWNDDDAPGLVLFRFAHESQARLTLKVNAGELRATLSAEQLLALRNACNDALADIAGVEADRERRESLDAISEELREAAARGDGSSTGVLYAHPDVHYVAPDQVAAKVAELEAAGAPRYIVLPIDHIEGADDARSTRHYPSLEDAGAAA